MKKNKLGFIEYILYTFLLFLFIYQFRLEFIGLPASIHSTRIGAVGIVILGIFKNNKNNRNIYVITGVYAYLKLCIVILLYGFLLLFGVGKGSGMHITDAILNNLIITIPVIWGLTRIFDDLDSFLEILVCVGIIQSIFIIVCLISEPFQLIIDYAVNNTESETHDILILRKGYAGGVGCITADGMIRYTTGILATSYLYVKRQKMIYMLLFAVFAVLNPMIARTGLIMDVFCFIYICLGFYKNGNFLKYLFYVFIVIGTLFMIVSSGKYDSFIEERFHRFKDFKDYGLNEAFFGGYFGGQIPALVDNFVWGTGILSGTASNGVEVHVDGGPFRIYSAAGFIETVVIYLVLFKMIIKNINIQNLKRDKYFMFLLMMFFIVADVKEITFFLAWPLAFYFTIAVLMLQSNNNNRFDNYFVSNSLRNENNREISDV